MSTTSAFPAPSSLEEEPLLLESRHDESEPLVAHASVDDRGGRWKPHPYWVIPIVLAVNISRGMTLSPRINVYADIACRAVGSSAPTNGLATLLVAEDCKAPAVHARASQVQASVLTVMNVLSSASTGLWSQYGDVRGRKIIFCVSVIGFICMELVFLLVSGSITAIPSRGESLILIGPILEGFAGGLSVFNGVMHAYVSDCTADGSRSRIFSIVQGMVFVGLAIGPWVAGILMSFGLGPYSMFSVSIGIQLVLLFYIVFIFPESLRSQVESLSPDREIVPNLARSSSPPSKTLKDLAKGFTAAFISPITIFRPRAIDDSPGTTSRKDYNVTLMGLAMLLYITSTGVYQVKYLYGKNRFEWDPAQLGYYMSLLWICRAINLFVVLPLIVSYFKPKMPHVGASTPETIAAELTFDKRLAQGSLFVDGLSDLLVAATSSEVAFVAFSCLTSFASGGNPALNSLGAVCLHALGYGSETGKLFGAIGVLNAVSHSFSPALFATTYSKTVSTHPKMIFIVATGLLFTAVALLGRIRAKG